MDHRSFDRFTTLLGTTPSRRTALGLLVGAVVGVTAGPVRSTETEAKSKKKRKRCPKKPCPQGFKRDRRTCKCECVRTPCGGGKEFDTKSCRCRCPRNMRECRDGCVSQDACCPGDPPCPEDPKGCCHSPGVDVCTIDGCCAEIDGIKACNNFCVDTNANANHCGGCNTRCASGEACVDGACVLPEACPGGIFCPGRTAPHCAAEGFQCCGDRECNAFQECCNPNDDLCCPKGRCAGGQCCPAGRETCGETCCDVGKVCCGGDTCCSASQCVNGTCCSTGVCGAFGTGNKVCPTGEEFCCAVDPADPNSGGYACPRGDQNAGAADCAPNGQCCPAGTFYRESCNACCVDIVRLCDEQCVPPTAGRF